MPRFTEIAAKLKLMISICIPIYNYDVTTLVQELHRQTTDLDWETEILLIDDASDLNYQLQNRQLHQLSCVVYHELPVNIGRSRIRNLLAQKARFNWLLFMDCDSEITAAGFISDYIAQTHSCMVVCGGRVYQEEAPDKPFLMHWKYGKTREVRSAGKRNLKPYHSFMTNNFLIPKKVLALIPFDENIMGYGHEDTLFGFELMQKNVPVLHIDNPLRHICLENQNEFLQKSAEAVDNLFKIFLRSNSPESFAKFVKLLRLSYNAQRSLPGRWILSFIAQHEQLFHKILAGNNACLLWYDLLRLAWLWKHWKNHSNNHQSM